MADAKISALTAYTAPIATDVIPIVDVTAGATKKIQADSFINYSMSRQAIINGNFDVWQRGVSVTPADGTNTYQADHWADSPNKDGGTPPTLSRTREAVTAGSLYKSFYFSRLSVNGAGSSFGVNSNHYYYQKIEHGTRFLCGDGKKVTVSIYANSSIANKRLGVSLLQCYGTGGTPTTSEPIITSAPVTLTSGWVQYNFTFTTNTLAGKTFGTANDDYLMILIHYQWGTTFGNTYLYPSVTAESYVGSGTIDIAQIQICSGDVSLPFQPKTFGEELQLCKRYYQKSAAYGTAPSSAGDSVGRVFWGVGVNVTGQLYAVIILPTAMRAIPTLHSYDNSGNLDKVYRSGDTKAMASAYVSEKSFLMGTTDATSAQSVEFHWTAESEL